MKTKPQHKKPCHDCPWRRVAMPGWVGGETPEEWVDYAHSEAKVDCHIHNMHQCAGLAIYRANVSKVPRDPHVLRLPADRENVFARPDEFLDHHNQLGHTSADNQ